MMLLARNIAHKPHNGEMRVEQWYIVCPACDNEDVHLDYDPDAPMGKHICGNRECGNCWLRVSDNAVKPAK